MRRDRRANFRQRSAYPTVIASAVGSRFAAGSQAGVSHTDWERPMAQIEHERPFQRPLSGAKVARLPSAQVPARTALIGRLVTLEPLDAARHAGDLFEAS